MNRLPIASLVILLSVILVGCGDDSDTGGELTVTPPNSGVAPGATDPTGTSGAGTPGPGTRTDPSGAAAGTLASRRPAWPDRDTLDGHWLLRTPQIIPPSETNPQPQVGENLLLLLDLTAGSEESSGSVKQISGRMDFETFNVGRSSVAGDSVDFGILDSAGVERMSFQGRFKGGVVVGCMVDVSGNSSFVRITPTDERTFARIPVFAHLPAAEVEQFNRLAKSPVPEEDSREFGLKFPSSPLISMGHQMAVSTACQQGIESERLEGLIAAYVKQQSNWGERIALITEVDAIQRAVTTAYDPVWCLKQLDAIEKKLESDELLKGVRERVGVLRKQTFYNQAIVFLGSEDDKQRAEGEVIATDIIKTRPHDAVLTLSLADAARLDGRNEDAIKLYAQLVALPMQERLLQEMWRHSPIDRVLPTERLAALWKDVHKGTDGLDEFIQQTYNENVVSFPVETVEPQAEAPGNRTVLAELFTGVRCPVSIAAEVALSGLDRAWPDSTLVTLRYHIHMAGQTPGHDPLANEDNEARYFNYYRTNFTPRVFLDGSYVPGLEGGMVDADRVQKGMSSIITQLLEEKSEVSIDLSAIRQDDTIQISCTATSEGELEDNVRLRLVLAESGVKFQAFNGIRQHDMVARQLLGGDAGVAPADGKLHWQDSLNVEDLRTELHDYLTRYETNQGVEFTSTPLDLNNLSVVAIVQTETTHRVLQCRVVAVK